MLNSDDEHEAAKKAGGVPKIVFDEEIESNTRIINDGASHSKS
jgi:hypothetical protein